MNIKNITSITIIIMFILFTGQSFSQEKQNTSHPFSNSWIISAEGGINIGATDFPDMKIDYAGRGSFEYFLPTSSSSTFGIKLLAGGGYIAGQGLLSSAPGYVNLDEFRTKIVYGGAGLVYSLSLGEIVQPYVFAGLSYMIFDPLKENGNKMPRNAAGAYDDDDRGYMVELGIRFLISDNFSLNLGYTFNHLINDNIDDIYTGEEDAYHSIFGGISYYILSSSDEDGDGIKDSKDMCENTPKDVIVDEFGCPIDSDSDKIPDYLDLCSDTPAQVVVDDKGCPIDTDMDGIADYLDHCPESAENAKVNDRGCEEIILKAPDPEIKKNDFVEDERLILVLSGSANFQTGKAELLPNPKAGLDKLSEFMKEHPNTSWIIEGHADNKGKEKFNKKLSLARAKSVLYYFGENGIDINRFEIIGSGANNPIADNSIEFGRVLNRRVTIQEKHAFEKSKRRMQTFGYIEYDFLKEYNIESLIFTDDEYYCIQVSAWKNRDKATKEVEKLKANGHSAFFIMYQSTPNSERWFRVRIGYFDNLEGARKYLNRVR